METPKKTYSKQGGRPKVGIGRICKYVVSTRLSPERKLRFSALCREAGQGVAPSALPAAVFQSNDHSDGRCLRPDGRRRPHDRSGRPRTKVIIVFISQKERNVFRTLFP